MKILTIGNSQGKGNVRGQKLEKQCERILDSIENKYPQIIKKITKQDKANKNKTLDEIPDFSIKFQDERLIYLTCQISFWGGGHQSNRGNNYLKKDAFHIVAEKFPKNYVNKNKTLFERMIDDNRVIYPTELEESILRVAEKKK